MAVFCFGFLFASKQVSSFFQTNVTSGHEKKESVFFCVALFLFVQFFVRKHSSSHLSPSRKFAVSDLQTNSEPAQSRQWVGFSQDFATAMAKLFFFVQSSSPHRKHERQITFPNFSIQHSSQTSWSQHEQNFHSVQFWQEESSQTSHAL